LYTANVVRVMMASPGDVEQERHIIRSVLEDWNIGHSERERLVLLPVSWHTHAVPEVGDRPQGLINTRVLSKCDLLVAVFWTRVGSPTGVAISGTVEEIEAHVKAGRPAMVYFSKKPVALDRVNMKQYEQLKKYLRRFQKTAIVDMFEDDHKFRERFGRALPQVINDHFTGFPAAPPPDPDEGKYRRVKTTGGATVYEFITDDPTQHHYVCVKCRLPLQPLGELSGKFKCPGCDEKYPIKPAQPFPEEPVRYARTSRSAWDY
jgi:hypothetical protein